MNDVLSVDSLIEFLLRLLGDENAQAEFERDPHGMLARNGLDHLSAQDVCDVAPLLADHDAVHVKNGGSDPSLHHHDDPVRAISSLKDHYGAKNTVVDNSDHYNLTYVDDRDTIINIDDRDVTIQANGDVSITDSFNEDNSVTVIEDSFNQDNDGVDNKGGTIDGSAVEGTVIEESPEPGKSPDSGDETDPEDETDSEEDATGGDPVGGATIGDDTTETIGGDTTETIGGDTTDDGTPSDLEVPDEEEDADDGVHAAV